jgi:PhnB protein
MKSVNAYLNFDGTCREAMTFYAKCMDADLRVMPFSQMPGDLPPGAADRVMHACLTKGSINIMASDTFPGMTLTQGNNVYLCVSPDNKEETDRLFAALSEGGTVESPLEDQFWGAYFGTLKDRFGILWMFNCETKPKGE